MASLVINNDTVTVAMSTAEKAEAFHRDLTIPRSAVTGARAVPDGMAEVHGIRMPGAYFPDMIMVGTWRGGGLTTFAVCHGHQPAVVLDLSGEHYDRIVMTVENPESIVTALA